MIERRGRLTVLHSASEQPYVIALAAEAPERRAQLLTADGLDATVIAISSPIGIEALPRESSLELIDAHLSGVAGLPEAFAAWGPVALDGADPDDVDERLAQGCVGISLPAGALAGPHRLDALGPVLERIAQRRVPLFVHPGPATGQTADIVPFGEPLWWRALTDYVAQQQAAWLTLASFGRRDNPGLAIVFAMLAGCAPLHHERLSTRGGPPLDLRDPLIFYDTSSYGPQAVDAMARVVGEDRLAYGSDRPVVEPLPTRGDARFQACAGLLAGGIAV